MTTPAPASVPRMRRFKQCLTPALHKRFNRAAGLVLGVCYFEAILIGDKSSWIWSWFPLGLAGIRTLLLFLAALAVFVLRVAQLHLGSRSTVSPFKTFRKEIFSVKVINTFAWYGFSAWLFSEIYLWSASKDANLGWISDGKPWERNRLNERPIYLRSIYLMLTIAQTALHLFFDYDRVSLPIDRRKDEDIAKKQAAAGPQKLPTIIQPMDELRSRMPSLLRAIGLQTASIATVGPIIYALFIRRRVWDMTMFFTKLLWDVAPVQELSYIPPYHISLILRSMTSGFLLIFLWQSSNTIFSAFFTQEPLKRGQPLTAESSVPNEALLDGMKFGVEVNMNFAFWELLYISKYFEDRRKSIFTEIESRPGLSTWARVMQHSLSVIQAVSTRITEYQTPPSTSTPTQPQANVETLPRIAPNLRQGQIYVSPSAPSTRFQKVEKTVGNMAKSIGQSPPSRNTTPVGYGSPYVKRVTNAAGQKLLTQGTGQQTNLTPAGLRETFDTYLLKLIRSPLGYPFRQTFVRCVNAVAFGTAKGYSDVFVIVNAIEALSILAVASLSEDPYGKVAYDVGGIMRVYILVLDSLQRFVEGMGTHWTDVHGPTRSGDVDLVCAKLKEGLGRMVDAFEPYAIDFGIERSVMLTAKEVARANEYRKE